MTPPGGQRLKHARTPELTRTLSRPTIHVVPAVSALHAAEARRDPVRPELHATVLADHVELGYLGKHFIGLSGTPRTKPGPECEKESFDISAITDLPDVDGLARPPALGRLPERLFRRHPSAFHDSAEALHHVTVGHCNRKPYQRENVILLCLPDPYTAFALEQADRPGDINVSHTAIVVTKALRK